MLVNPLKTILKGFWWHIAVGPTNVLSHVFYINDMTLPVLSSGTCGEDVAAVCLQALVLSLGVTHSVTERSSPPPPGLYLVLCENAH